MSTELTINVSFPASFKTEDFMKIWTLGDLNKKAHMLLFLDRVKFCNKDIIIPNVSKYIYVSRSPVVLRPSAGNNNAKYFQITAMTDRGHTFCDKVNLISIYNYDKALLRAVVRSFPPKTFEWDAVFEDDKPEIYYQ